ncbi:MAG: thioredoxin domain-containing protein [Elusimicrobia bacterium]|nr:thioredoxin domain-containing protein [Elusimicrobiota bacterium]
MTRARRLALGGVALLAAGLASAAAAGRKPNHLVAEKSPYLLQHAYNPVDWHPWGEEAFAKARRENKPVFLSIGYSTCHWCHVMERESFSNPKIAAVLNANFVSIKVDREERPDVDKVYMTAATGAGWGGGWPLNLWLTPDLKPFFGGTYFPPDSRGGRPGLAQLTERIAELWKSKRDGLQADADRLGRALEKYTKVEGSGGPLEPAALDSGFKAFVKTYEPSRGGFGGAPKFPMPVNFDFLLRYHARTKAETALEMSVRTLREMAKGGIHDHVGGGFHRYSTDDRWHIPHFEKMLYDNAQIAVNYLEAYRITRAEDLALVARGVLDYVRRDMTHPEGGFYSAEDADSLPPELLGKVEDVGHEHRKEGAFYVWTQAEILDAAGPGEGEIFDYRYGVSAGGNAESDPQGEFGDKNILYAAHTIPETAKRFKRTEDETRAILETARQRLFRVRAKRPRPHLDDKVLVSWNGLMISAFAQGAQVLDDPAYLAAAEKAARFIRANLYDAKRNRLYRRWRAGERKVPGIADDYAFLVQGLLDLYETSLRAEWLEWAVKLSDAQNELFYDAKDGGFFMTASGHDKRLLVRVKEDSDNVEPAASSVAALNLLRLSWFTGRKDFREKAEKTLALFGTQMRDQPRSLPRMMVALDYSLAKPRQIVIAGERDAPETRAMLREVHSRFLPNKILMLLDRGPDREALERRLPFLKGVVPIKGRTAAYVCVDYACELPTSDLETFKAILDGKRPSERTAKE